MGKRSEFERNPKDFYETPIRAVEPLISHLPGQFRYVSPCYGGGNIYKHLDRLHNQAHCVGRAELYPEEYDTSECGAVIKADARDYQYNGFFDMFIENPPWERKDLHQIIMNLSAQAPTWLLFDADWMHTKQAVPYLKYCAKIISIGRVSWMGNGVSGKDNCCWYLFDKNYEGLPQLVGRVS